MAFEGLSSRLQEITRKIRGKARITESDLKEMLREVKLALLEADVNYKIVKDFIAQIQEKALGADVLKSLTPGQQVIKIVKDEMVELLGGVESGINFTPNPPTIIMLVGLQGSGKTTTAGKLANLLRKQGKKPLLVACDIYRPAAIEQLEVLATQNKIDFYKDPDEKNVNNIIKNAIKKAEENNNDVLIIDTAGRQSVDKKMMDELVNITNNFEINESLLVIDGMIGQISVDIAKEFNNAINLTGIILSKMDGDSNGGVALSVTAHVNKPIKFISIGEKIDQIESFYPDRIANRILGKGDITTLLEKADKVLNEDDDDIYISKNTFSYNEMIYFINKVEKIGGVNSILCFLPDSVKINNNNVKDVEYVINNLKIIYNSMTPNERKCYSKLNLGRKIRIAKGSGKTIEEVEKIVKFFEKVKQMMKLSNNKTYNNLINMKNNKI